MAKTFVRNLKPNPKNPRTITDEKLKMLDASLKEFGDLSAIVYNRKTKQIAGGHQRLKLLPKDAPVEIEREYKKPTKAGTVAEGYIELNGERLKYREVEWDAIKEKAANIAANRGAGEWDIPALSEMLREIDEFGFELDLTMFNANERQEYMVPTVNPNFQPASENEQGRLDEKTPIECPHCGVSFVPKH